MHACSSLLHTLGWQLLSFAEWLELFVDLVNPHADGVHLPTRGVGHGL
jgi:hypothetical protein